MSIDIHNHAIPDGVLDLVAAKPAYGVTISDGVWSSRDEQLIQTGHFMHMPREVVRFHSSSRGGFTDEGSCRAVGHSRST